MLCKLKCSTPLHQRVPIQLHVTVRQLLFNLQVLHVIMHHDCPAAHNSPSIAEQGIVLHASMHHGYLAAHDSPPIAVHIKMLHASMHPDWRDSKQWPGGISYGTSII